MQAPTSDGTTRPGVRWVHRILAVVLCLGYPLATRIERGWGPAWAMFTTSTTFRLRIVVHAHDGRAFEVAPSRLAPLATTAASSVLTGAETWHHAPLFTLPEHLDALGTLACRFTAARSATVHLELRRTLSASPVMHTANVECAR